VFSKTHRPLCFVLILWSRRLLFWLDLAIEHPLEKVPCLFEHNRVQEVEFLLQVPIFFFGRQKAVPLLLQAHCINNHIAPGGTPMKVLPQPANDSQSCCNDRGHDRKRDPQPFRLLDKLGGGDRGNKGYQGSEKDRLETNALI
jgi:hypothetical protein